MSIIDRFQKQREKVRKAIYDRPGVMLTQLAPATQNMTAEERKARIGELIAMGEVKERITQPTHGPPRCSYWPKDAAPVKVELSPLDAALQELQAAKANCLTVMGSVEAAITQLQLLGATEQH